MISENIHLDIFRKTDDNVENVLYTRIFLKTSRKIRTQIYKEVCDKSSINIWSRDINIKIIYEDYFN